MLVFAIVLVLGIKEDILDSYSVLLKEKLSNKEV